MDLNLNLDEDVDVDFLNFLSSDSYSDFGYILAEDKTIPKEDDIDRFIESETSELKDISHKNFYKRDSWRLRMKIEDYMGNLVPVYEQYIKNELHILQKYIENIVKKKDLLRCLDKKSYDYECMVLTIKELYDRVTHQFEEYYELNHTYKLYTYKGEYKQFVYSYDQLILSYKKQFVSCIETINHFIVKLD
jgi:hypothetical protein